MTGFDSKAKETNPEIIISASSGSANPKYIPFDLEGKSGLSPKRKKDEDEDDLEDEDDEFSEDEEDDEFEDDEEFTEEEPVDEEEIYEEDFDFDEDEDLLEDDDEDVPYN